ncbi:hypothetical protein TNCV_982131 [Trichonephila clavipes]|nr:hypothetical protein TNCV_982131 [Trichonephila clavipes]
MLFLMQIPTTSCRACEEQRLSHRIASPAVPKVVLEKSPEESIGQIKNGGHNSDQNVVQPLCYHLRNSFCLAGQMNCSNSLLALYTAIVRVKGNSQRTVCKLSSLDWMARVSRPL